MDWTDVEMELCAVGEDHLAGCMHDEVQKMHGLLLWALYHHQGVSSPVGQPIRRALGIDAHAPLTAVQLAHAKQTAGSLSFNAKVNRRRSPKG